MSAAGVRSSSLDLIKGLLSLKPKAKVQQKTEHSHSPETTNKQPPTEEGVRAEIVPRYCNYIARDSPKSLWRERHLLATKTRRDVGKPVSAGAKRLEEERQEIVFGESHRRTLGRPYPSDPGAVQYRRHAHVRYRNIMKSHVQILTTPTADTPGTTLLMHFDNKRYLIGSLAEGTQRACMEMGARMLKVSECFVTGRTEWSNTGGLIGMILTLADQIANSRQGMLEDVGRQAQNRGKKMGILDDAEKMRALTEELRSKVKENGVLKIFSPPNLNHTLATARKFVFRKGTPVEVHEINEALPKEKDEDEWAPYWADENIKVWAMSISPSEAPSEEKRASRPATPRKRTIDEVYDRQSTNGAILTDGLTQKERDLLTVKAVVSEMFDSSWRLDTLHETPLSQVKLPAAIFVRNKETNKIEKYRGSMPGGGRAVPDPDLTVLVRRPWPGALVERLPEIVPAKEAISYIFRTHTQRGKFDPKLAKELKISEKPKFSQLANGISVQNDDGDTITPDQVLGPSKEGGGIAVIDLPDPSYIENMLSRPEWDAPQIMTGVGAFVWICGKGVTSDQRIYNFMRRFENVEHLVSSSELCSNDLALQSSAAATLRLRRVDPARYGVPTHTPASKFGQEDGLEPYLLTGDKAQLARRGQVLQTEPMFVLRQDEVSKPVDIANVENEMAQDVLNEAIEAQKHIEAAQGEHQAWVDSVPNRDAEVITLGTGSALPSKYRNVSATLVRIPGWGNILLDCGENTFGQLRRVFAPQELKQVLRDLRLLFISHMHADHHLGTVGVLKAWYAEVHNCVPAPLANPSSLADIKTLLSTDQKRLAVISEPAMISWLSEYSAVEDYGFSRLAPINISPALPHRNKNSSLNWFIAPHILAQEPSQEAMANRVLDVTFPSTLLNLSAIDAVLVQHCHGARAVSITLPSGFKVSYSGDCRPSKAFEQIGKGSTVVIHEATFDDELVGDAIAKNHSTTSEALSIAQGMRAKACVLTHFSQRYQKIPVLDHGAEGKDLSMGDQNDDATATEADAEMDIDHEMSANPDDAMNGPVEDLAATLPDQTSNGDKTGQQHELPFTSFRRVNSGPEAVKFKLNSDMKVCVAFDMMRVKVGELWQMQYFTPALLKLFAEEDKKVEGEVVEIKGQQGHKGPKKEKNRKKRESVDVKTTVTADP